MENEQRLDLIDRNYVQTKIEKTMVKLIAKQAKAELAAALSYVSDIIEETPTVDAEPVVHGHWVKHNFLGHEQWACSECQTLGSPQWKRCPVCEAKMDGGNEDG